MHTKLFLIAAISLLAAGCAGVRPSSGSADPSLGSTSYQSGYGVRPNGPQSGADNQLDWGW